MDSANKNSSSSLLSQLDDRFELAAMCSSHWIHSRVLFSTPNYPESNVNCAWKDRGINLTKKPIYKLNLHLFENMVYLQFKSLGFEAICMQPAYSSQLETTHFMLSCIFIWFFVEISLSKPN